MERRRWSQTAVVGATLLLAVLARAPFGVLYIFPVAATLTLHGAHRPLRIVALVVSMAMLPLSVMIDLARLHGL